MQYIIVCKISNVHSDGVNYMVAYVINTEVLHVLITLDTFMYLQAVWYKPGRIRTN